MKIEWAEIVYMYSTEWLSEWYVIKRFESKWYAMTTGTFKKYINVSCELAGSGGFGEGKGVLFNTVQDAMDVVQLYHDNVRVFDDAALD